MSDTSHTQRLEFALAGKYRIERKLGEGGMATVYLAEDIKHERKVAIKILRPELAAVIGAERFLAEIKTTANLQHPHILPLFDSGEADSFLYYVMPYIDGETLGERIAREQQLGVDDAVRIARDVGDALDYAHRNDIIHRDIKPANILLHDGRPVVADFGIALAISAAGGGRMTETGLSLGTPHYMSPEQASADRDLSARSDVYSLGCVLYEMLAGQPPHTGPSAQSILVRILTEDPRPLTEVRRSVAPHIASTVAKAIEKLPADRFDSASQFVDALADPTFTHLGVSRVPTTATGAGSVRGSATPRSRLAAALPWALAAVLGGVAAWSTVNVPPTLPVTRTEISLNGLIPELLAVSSRGDAFAFAVVVDGEPRIAVRRSSEAEFRQISGTGVAFWPIFSPDGEWLAYGSEEGLMKVAIAGGAPQPIIPDPDGEGFYQPLDWSDDGYVLYSGYRQDQGSYEVRRVFSAGGEPELIHRADAEFGQSLPGGNVLLGTREGPVFVDAGRDTAWAVLSPAAGTPRFANGHILWVDETGALWAAGFNPSSGQVDDRRGIVLEGISVNGRATGEYDVSENGTLMYSTGGLRVGRQSQQLVTVYLDGTVVEEPLAPRDIERPRWSPDGRFITYAGVPPDEQGEAVGRQVYIYDVQVKGRPRRITDEGPNRFPIWSPDGTRIAFSSSREGSQFWDLYVKTVGHDSPATLLLSLPGYQAPADWISENQMLIEGGEGMRNEPWIVDLPTVESGDSASARPFFESESNHNAPYLAPQGDLVTYSSDVTGAMEVYVRSFPVSGAPEKISVGGGDFPRWSADGNVIYFIKGVGQSPSMWAARIDRGPTFAVAGVDSLMAFPYIGSPHLHPDGDRFITARDEGAAAVTERRHFIVTNWFTEMEARLRGGR